LDLKRIKDYFVSKGYISVKSHEYDEQGKRSKDRATVLFYNQSFFDAYKIDINSFYQDHTLHVPRVEIYKNDNKKRKGNLYEKFRVIYELKNHHEEQAYYEYSKIIKDYRYALSNLSDYNISDILVPTFWDNKEEEIVHPIEYSKTIFSNPYCVFGENLEELGRMQYKFQHEKSDLRLNTLIRNSDGSYARLVEHDLKNAQVRIFFQINNYKDIPTDIYAVKEVYEKYNMYDPSMLRYLIKKILMIVPNTNKMIEQRVGAAIKAYNKKKKPNMIRINKKEHGSMIEDIMLMLKNSHEGLRELFNRSSEYKTLQNLEARINLQIIKKSLENNMLPLCVHDCWYFAEYHDQDLVKTIIEESYAHVLKEYYPAIEDTSCVIETVYNTNTDIQFEDGTEATITNKEEKDMSDNKSQISKVKLKPYNKVDGGEFVGTDSHELWDNDSRYDDASCLELFELLTQDMVAEQIELDYTDERQLLQHIKAKVSNSDEDLILDEFWNLYKGDASTLHVYNLYTQLAA